jgi:hypothetical protein
MNSLLKQRLHELIDNCDNELLLEEVKAILQLGNDWWDKLPAPDKNLLMESEAKYGKGIFISHEELIKRFQEWQNDTTLTDLQKQALDKELEAIKTSPNYLKKWDDIKGQFKKA